MPYIYVHDWVLCCCHSLNSIQKNWSVLIASVDRDKECPFSGVTNCGRVWRKVPESSAQFGGRCRKAVLSLEEGAGKQCSVWRTVPEAVLSLEDGAGKQCSVWRKVPESSAQFGGRCRKAVLSLEDGAGKQCSVWRTVPESSAQFGGRCRKAVLSLEEGARKQCSVWRTVPESSAQFGGRCRKAVLSLEEGAGKQCSECVTLSSQLQAAFILNEQFSADIGEKNYS